MRGKEGEVGEKVEPTSWIVFPVDLSVSCSWLEVVGMGVGRESDVTKMCGIRCVVCREIRASRRLEGESMRCPERVLVLTLERIA